MIMAYPKKANTLIGCLCKHFHMDLGEFYDNYHDILLDKFSKGNISTYFVPEFSTDFLQHDHQAATNKSSSSHMFLTDFIKPIRVRNNCKTLIGSIFSNIIAADFILLPQFLIISFGFL